MEKNNSPIFASVKVAGEYPAAIREEAERRKVSLNSLVTEYALAGFEAVNSPDSDKLAGFERRMASTMISLRSDVEDLTSTVDVVSVMLDSLVKLLLLHLPEPATDTLDGAMASAQGRYENLLRFIATTGFDDGRPAALRKIAMLLAERLA